MNRTAPTHRLYLVRTPVPFYVVAAAHPIKPFSSAPCYPHASLLSSHEKGQAGGGREKSRRRMDLALLTPAPSIPSRHLLFSPSNPATLFLRLPPRRHRACRRGRLCVPRSSASDAAATDPAPAVDPSVFGGRRELSGPQVLVDALPPPARVASSVVIAAAALAAGYGLGLRFGGSRVAGLGGAAALGAAGGAVVYALNSSVPEVAAVNLHNLLASFDDPTAVSKEDVEAVAKKLVGLYLFPESLNSFH